jgi:hypothetical protein
MDLKPAIEKMDALNLKVESKIAGDVNLDTKLMELGYTAEGLETLWHLQQLENDRKQGWKSPKQAGLKPIEKISELLKLLLSDLKIQTYEKAKEKQRKNSIGWGTEMLNAEGDQETILNVLARCITTEEKPVQTLDIVYQWGRDEHSLGVVAVNNKVGLAHGILRAGDNLYVYWQHKRG